MNMLAYLRPPQSGARPLRVWSLYSFVLFLDQMYSHANPSSEPPIRMPSNSFSATAQGIEEEFAVLPSDEMPIADLLLL